MDLWEDLEWVAVSGLKVSSSVGQEELAVLRRQLEGKDVEMRRLHDESSYKSIASSGADPTDRGGKDFCHHKPCWRACPVLDVTLIYILSLTEWFYQA